MKTHNNHNNGQNMVRLKKANDFLIWRVGSSVGWDCTVSDIARETGLHKVTVGRTLSRRGWEATGDIERPQAWGDSRYDLISMMESTELGSMEDDQ